MGEQPPISFSVSAQSLSNGGGATTLTFGRDGRGIQRLSELVPSVSHSSHVLSGPSAIGERWIVPTHQWQSYSSHTARHAQGQPKSPRIGVPSCGAAAGSNQAEQGEAAQPALRRVLAGFFFGLGVLSVFIGFRRCGLLLLDVR